MQLTYTSSAKQEVTPSLVIDILEAARRNNAQMGVTGLLYCANARFAQVLEGPVDAVEQIFAKIAEDPRHWNLVAQRYESGERMFSNWAMTFVDASSVEMALVLMKHETDTYDPTRWRTAEVLPILTSVAAGIRGEAIPIRY